jgi:glutamate--cysteine ligase
MRKYLPTRGELALDMMLRTSTVQANYDFSSEDDAMRKMQVALRLSPLTTAMFANSPFYEGSLFAGKSFRANVWTDVDPDRSGLVPALWGEHPRLVDYVEWALDAPMFMFKRDGKSMDNTGQTFRSFWKDGFRGHKPTQGDWQTHLNTLFPDVRLKKTIEVRGADAQRSTLAPALPALFAGILYDAKALEQAWSLVESFRVEDLQQLRGRIWKNSLQTPFGQGTLTDLASKVIEIAEGGLARRAHLDASGRDERVHLAELKALAAQGRCPADALLDKVAPKGKAPENVAEFRRVVIEASTLTAS